MTLMPSQPEKDEHVAAAHSAGVTGATAHCYSQRRSMPDIKPNPHQIHSQIKRNSYQEESNINVSSVSGSLKKILNKRSSVAEIIF